MERRKKTMILSSLFIGCIFCTLVLSKEDYTIKEFQKRIEQVQRELINCANDQSKLQPKLEELERLALGLQEKLMEEFPASLEGDRMIDPSNAFNMLPTMDEALDRQKAIHKELAAFKDNPCYGTLFDKAYAKRYYGNDLDELMCIPIDINLTWNIDEEVILIDGRPTSHARYTLEEQYTGYLKIMYHREDRDRIRYFHIRGPSPQTDENISCRLTSVSVEILGHEYGHGYWGRSRERMFGTSNPGDFEVIKSPLRTGVSFYYEDDVLRRGEHVCVPGDVRLIEDRIMPHPFARAFFHPLPGGICDATAREPATTEDPITVKDIERALIQEKLVKEYTFSDKHDYTQGAFPSYDIYKLNGNVQVVISLAPGGILAVSPSNNLNSSGPDENDEFEPSEIVYTVENKGSSPLFFNISKKEKWLSLSKDNGSLSPRESTSVKVTISEEARSLKEGIYKDRLEFVNLTNGKGNTSRSVVLDVGEEHTWLVKLTGQETVDYGGKLMRVMMDNKWKNITVGYGVRLDYAFGAEFTVKKKKGKWIYIQGKSKITDASVRYSLNYDPTVFSILRHRCLNSEKLGEFVGSSLRGHVSGESVRLFWPLLRPVVEVESKIKLKHDSNSNRGSSRNLFESAIFLETTHDHDLPLTDGVEKKIPKTMRSHKDQYRLDQKKQISIYYRYLMRGKK